jgi:hypothetical protein
LASMTYTLKGTGHMEEVSLSMFVNKITYTNF